MLLEDEALMVSCDRDEKNESTDESITEEMDIYNGVNNIKHKSNFSSDDDDVDMEFFCDHF